MTILAIDPATKCGYAVEHEYGVWDLSNKQDESNGIKWLRFKRHLAQICEQHKVTVIAFERPAGRHKSDIVHHAKMAGILEMFAEEQGIEFCAYSPSQVKAYATGKGNSGKAEVVKAAKDKLGYKGNDDNEADALWILELCRYDLRRT